MTNELTEKQNTSMLATQAEPVMGFEDEDSDDLIIPRVKVIQLMSPEFKEKVADEGDIINSLTKEKLTGKKFIPVFKFTNVIKWKDRADGGGIEAISHDGKMMIPSDGSAPYPVGRLADFDNTKQGKDAIPTHVRYMNFFGFFEGEMAPIILSFAKTNYAEGKKLYSLAKVTMQNMWNHGYVLENKKKSKGGNEWYIVNPVAAGPTTEEDRAFGMALYQQFRANISNVAFDMDDSGSGNEGSAPHADVENAEY